MYCTFFHETPETLSLIFIAQTRALYEYEKNHHTTIDAVSSVYIYLLGMSEFVFRELHTWVRIQRSDTKISKLCGNIILT